jgi:hypothetical protein
MCTGHLGKLPEKLILLYAEREVASVTDLTLGAARVRPRHSKDASSTLKGA